MHLAFDDKDHYSVNLILTEWRRKGFVGEAETSTASRGYISIRTANWKRNDGSLVVMELHKLKGDQGLFGTRTNWIVRLLSCSSKNSPPIVRGCVEGRNPLAPFDRAMVDVGYNFMSRTRLEDYFVA